MSNKIIICAIIIIICIMGIGIGIYAQFFYVNSNEDKFMLGLGEEAEKKETRKELELNFENIFQNSVKIVQVPDKTNKKDETKEIIYTDTNFVAEKAGYYDIDINIPKININSETIEKVNNNITSLYTELAKEILLQQEQHNIIYNVDYEGYINQNILSLVIKATIKQDKDVQRTIIKTYNYEINENKELSLQEIIEIKKLNENAIQNEITQKIEEYNKENLSLNILGYEGHVRDVESEMYEIENAENFFLGEEGFLYIVYSYGNKEETNLIDIIVI